MQFNRQSSNYIAFDFLAELTRKDVDLTVGVAKSNADINHAVFSQIMMDAENSGQQMLPVGFLKQLTILTGCAVGSACMGQLTAHGHEMHRLCRPICARGRLGRCRI